MGVGTFRALQGLKMAEVDNSRALAEFRKKLLLHKELDARLKTGKQTDLCVCVCVCVCVSLDKMLLQGLRIDRFSCIPTRRSVFFVFGNDNFCFRFRGMVYQYKDREKKKTFWYRHRFKVRDVINKNPLQFPDCFGELRNGGEGF